MNKHNRIFLYALVPYIILLLGANQANATSATFMEGQFEEVMTIPKVNSIEAWEQPRTQYTPKNLRSEYQIRYNGTDTNGRNAYSYTTHFTDYDTHITRNARTQDGYYYIEDNTGRGFITGEVAKDYDKPIAQLQEDVSNNTANINNNTDLINNNIKRIDNNSRLINNNTNLINDNTKQINSVNNRVNGLSNQVSGLSNRVDNLDSRLDNMNSKMKQGFATVTALTSLHPNPRSNEKLEVSIGTGIYEDTFAGAIGLFYHPNDRVQVYAGAAYGGHESWAGGVGVTFGIGRKD